MKCLQSIVHVRLGGACENAHSSSSGVRPEILHC